MLRKLAQRIHLGSRKRRAQLFQDTMTPVPGQRVLDLGSDDGSFLASALPFREGVCIADVAEGALRHGSAAYGFDAVCIGQDARLPFADRAFDIVFCNSVIEHVTVDKENVWKIQSSRAFHRQALSRQAALAREIRRIGKGYFVQTPNKWFPIEPHTLLPFLIVVLPRPLHIRVLRLTNKFWIMKMSPDWRPLTKQEMRTLFPDALVVEERMLGFSKSLIAIKRPEISGS